MTDGATPEHAVRKDAAMSSALEGFSIEVMPRTAAKIASFKDLLPEGTRIYVACIEGTPLDDMVATAKRLRSEGFPVMVHIPARMLSDRAELERIVSRYRNEADVRQALVLGGGTERPRGDYDRSMQVLETGLLDEAGFTDIHVAGHPEGNRDIDPDGATRMVDKALLEKQEFSTKTDARMAIVTQFAFDFGPVADWAKRIRDLGVALPIHVGVAGPARLQTLLKFALECGVGASIRVLQRRARDLRLLVQPFEPNEIVGRFAEARVESKQLGIDNVHLFPLGGIRASAEWVGRHRTAASTAQDAGMRK